MNTLEALQRRLASVRDMQGVVATMKTMAAVSIRQYEAAVEALDDYDRTLRMAFQILLRDRPLPSELPAGAGAVGAVVIGSDQGLCGQFNDEIARFAVDCREQLAPGLAAWRTLVVGLRVKSRLEEAGWALEGALQVPVTVTDVNRLVLELAPKIETWQSQSQVTRVYVFFQTRTGTATSRPEKRQLLPISAEDMQRFRDPWPSRTLPTYSMAWPELFSAVVREHLLLSLFRACAQSRVSENARRIAAMQAAEQNIDRRLAELTLSMQQQRQDAITAELLDVVTGCEALVEEPRK